jgi:hypothetical protein
VVFSCKEDDPKVDTENFTTYTIKSGQHSTNSNPKVVNSDELRFQVKFDHTAIYTTKDPSNQADINKLYGFSDCGTQHQQNSARFGWRWYNDQLEILAYCYSNGKREYKYLTSVDLDKVYDYRITAKDNEYIFSVNGVMESMARGCTNGGSKYRLYPYFGGDEVAPHDVLIKIREL